MCQSPSDESKLLSLDPAMREIAGLLGSGRPRELEVQALSRAVELHSRHHLPGRECNHHLLVVQGVSGSKCSTRAGAPTCVIVFWSFHAGIAQCDSEILSGLRLVSPFSSTMVIGIDDFLVRVVYHSMCASLTICPKTITLQHVSFGQLILGAVT